METEVTIVESPTIKTIRTMLFDMGNQLTSLRIRLKYNIDSGLKPSDMVVMASPEAAAAQAQLHFEVQQVEVAIDRIRNILFNLQA